jgi:hypothetical protein
MQRFMAVLSDPVDKIEFERSWYSVQPPNSEPRVEFVFAGQTISTIVHSDVTLQWPSAGFRQTFSAAVRRLNRSCNIRWL